MTDVSRGGSTSSTRPRPWWLFAPVIVVALLVFLLAIPNEVRHSAAFGFVRTLDSERGIAVTGGRLTPNFNGFSRVDLDLRAYTNNQPGDVFDLMVQVRRDQPHAPPERTVRLRVHGAKIADRKLPFADPFVAVRFKPIDDSAGVRFYVSVVPGPRHRDDVVTLWSFKTYSQVSGFEVVSAWWRAVPMARGPWWAQSGLLLATVAASASMIAMMTAIARPFRISGGK